MKLSAAIRIGSMTTKQITGCWHDGGNGRCALGAAYDAAGGSGWSSEWKGVELEGMFPILRMRIPLESNPSSYSMVGAMPLYSVIWRLNDHDEWPREKIADWVETLEAAQEEENANNTQAARTATGV